MCRSSMLATCRRIPPDSRTRAQTPVEPPCIGTQGQGTGQQALRLFAVSVQLRPTFRARLGDSVRASCQTLENNRANSIASQFVVFHEKTNSSALRSAAATPSTISLCKRPSCLCWGRETSDMRYSRRPNHPPGMPTAGDREGNRSLGSITVSPCSY